jgi:predicted metalloendopeptidase
MKYTFRSTLHLLCAVALPAILLFAVAPAPAQQSGQGAADSHGLNPAQFDKTCKPCEEFYKFVNNIWMTNNPIPGAYPSWGRLNELNERNREILHQILEEAAAMKTAAPGSVDQRIGDYYATCMDTTKIDAAGLSPLAGEFDKIAKISDILSLEAEVARLQSFGSRAMFGFGAIQDFKDSSLQTGGAGQGGIGLPDRDYYLKTDERSAGIRDAYHKHLVKMFVLMGDTPERAEAETNTVIAIETKLASASKTRVELRDPQKNYNRMNIQELAALTPHFDWAVYFRAMGFPGIGSVNVAQKEFFQQLDARLVDVPLADWKVYLRWHLVHAAAPLLSAPFVNENFDFFGRVLTGTTEQLPRWKRCVSATDRELGEALGQKYVARAFPPAAKARALAMVRQLVEALRDDIMTLPWMSPATRTQAVAKLNAIQLKIGYPDTWRDYSALRVDRASYVLNNFRAEEFEFRRDLEKIGKAVDRTEWGMTPPTLNAYYNPLMNEIVFPAGILQPPIFDAQADDAVNFGAMGAVIGHEMTHGFDDQGRQFDAHGNLKDWWTPEDAKNYQQRADCIQKQFDGFVVEPGLNENGKLVLGESIADLGGLTIAHAAFQKSQAGKPATLSEGYTPEQRFFLSYGRVWGQNNRPELERMLVTTDPHPLGRFRVSGPLANMPSFAAAFDCKPGEPMARTEEQRCRIW